MNRLGSWPFLWFARAPAAAGSRQKAMSAVLSPRSWSYELAVREDPLRYLGTQPRWSEANNVMVNLGRKPSLIDHSSPPLSPLVGVLSPSGHDTRGTPLSQRLSAAQIPHLDKRKTSLEPDAMWAKMFCCTDKPSPTRCTYYEARLTGVPVRRGEVTSRQVV